MFYKIFDYGFKVYKSYFWGLNKMINIRKYLFKVIQKFKILESYFFISRFNYIKV